MSVISFCVLVIELVDGDIESRQLDSLTYSCTWYAICVTCYSQTFAIRPNGSHSKERLVIALFLLAAKAYNEMSSKGKGVPVPIQGNRSKVAGTRKPQEFRITTYASVLTGSGEPKSTETSQVVVPLPTETKHFVSGNPFVEVTKGILHLYKDQ